MTGSCEHDDAVAVDAKDQPHRLGETRLPVRRPVRSIPRQHPAARIDGSRGGLSAAQHPDATLVVDIGVTDGTTRVVGGEEDFGSDGGETWKDESPRVPVWGDYGDGRLVRKPARAFRHAAQSACNQT